MVPESGVGLLTIDPDWVAGVADLEDAGAEVNYSSAGAAVEAVPACILDVIAI